VHYYGYRYYSADVGRWVSRDPMEEEGGINLYSVGDNDVVNNVDILGFVCVESVTGTLTFKFSNFTSKPGPYKWDPKINPGGKLGVGLFSFDSDLGMDLHLEAKCEKIDSCCTKTTWDVTLDTPLKHTVTIGIGVTIKLFSWINSIKSISALPGKAAYLKTAFEVWAKAKYTVDTVCKAAAGGP
jgi:hypothetical protein